MACGSAVINTNIVSVPHWFLCRPLLPDLYTATAYLCLTSRSKNYPVEACSYTTITVDYPVG